MTVVTLAPPTAVDPLTGVRPRVKLYVHRPSAHKIPLGKNRTRAHEVVLQALADGPANGTLLTMRANNILQGLGFRPLTTRRFTQVAGDLVFDGTLDVMEFSQGRHGRFFIWFIAGAS